MNVNNNNVRNIQPEVVNQQGNVETQAREGVEQVIPMDQVQDLSNNQFNQDIIIILSKIRGIINMMFDDLRRSFQGTSGFEFDLNQKDNMLNTIPKIKNSELNVEDQSKIAQHLKDLTNFYSNLKQKVTNVHLDPRELLALTPKISAGAEGTGRDVGSHLETIANLAKRHQWDSIQQAAQNLNSKLLYKAS